MECNSQERPKDQFLRPGIGNLLDPIARAKVLAAALEEEDDFMQIILEKHGKMNKEEAAWATALQVKQGCWIL